MVDKKFLNVIAILVCLISVGINSSFAAHPEMGDYQFELLGIDNNRGTFRVTQQQRIIEDGVAVDLRDFNHTGFQTDLPPALNALSPMNGIVPENAGYAHKRFRCNFLYRGSQREYEGVDPRPEAKHTLQASWQYQSDRDQHQTSVSLVFKILGDHVVNTLPFSAIRHEHVRTDPEVSVGRHFDGESVYPMRVSLQTWRDPRTRETYQKHAFLRDGDIFPGSRIIYIKPFANDRELKARDCIGTYLFDRDLEEKHKDQTIYEKALLYSDGRHIYLPKVRQELWRKDLARVSFFVASYEAVPLRFISTALIGNDAPVLPEGLYEGLRGAPIAGGDRATEIWRRLGGDPLEIRISVPRGISSVPGIYL